MEFPKGCLTTVMELKGKMGIEVLLNLMFVISSHATEGQRPAGLPRVF
jgi:hypothetical protein